MDLNTFNRQLEELEKRFKLWIEPIDRVCMLGMDRINKDGYTLDDYERENNEIAERQLAEYNPYLDMYALLDQICPMYLDATPQQRAEIRSAVDGKDGIWSGLINYVYKSAERLRSPSDKEWLRLGLAAISIEDCSQDYRDVFMALAELYVAAEKAGIEPKPYFKEVADLSSREVPSGGTTPVSKMLAEFHGYAVLEERRKSPEYWNESKKAPWRNRAYNFDQLGGYKKESGNIEERKEEKGVPWWKRILGFGK